jgi:hypothetical protein
MKKITLLTMVAASLLFVGCGDKKDGTPSENVAKAEQAIKDAVDASSKVVAEKASEAKEYIKEKADSVDVDAIKAKASDSLNKAKEAIAKEADKIKGGTKETTTETTEAPAKTEAK